MIFLLIFILNTFSCWFIADFIFRFTKHFNAPQSINSLKELYNTIVFMENFALNLETGTTTDAAFFNAAKCNTKDNALSLKVRIILVKVQNGMSFAQALKNPNAKQHGEFEAFTNSLFLAIKMGTDLVKLIEANVQLLSDKYVLQIEEFAAKIPIKMLFPVCIFFMPIILVLLCGGVLKELISIIG